MGQQSIFPNVLLLAILSWLGATIYQLTGQSLNRLDKDPNNTVRSIAPPMLPESQLAPPLSEQQS